MHGDQASLSPANIPSTFRRGLTRLARAAGIGLAALLATGGARAQDGIVQPGYAVVTGFSGVAATQAPPGADPFDYVGIDLGGASARVVDLTSLGPQGESNAPKIYTLTPGQVGQVFGVAIDDASPPNIYLAATSVYGLSISVPDSNGQMKRVRRGQAGAQFVPGQFGPPELGGNPGSIWRVDGTTGEVSPFATVGTAGYGAASLGGLAYDPATRQIFAVERSTGIVYRLRPRWRPARHLRSRRRGPAGRRPSGYRATADGADRHHQPGLRFNQPDDVGPGFAGAPRLRPRGA